MSSLNFTGRLDIPDSAVKLGIKNQRTRRRALDLKIDLQDLELPPDAHVIAEARHQGRFKRFEFGSVSVVAAPADLDLSEFDSDMPTFTINVIDPRTGQVLASRRNIRPVSAGKERSELLPVETADLGSLAWKLRRPIEPAGPVLLISNGIPGLETREAFRGLVLPEAFRAVMEQILFDPDLPECPQDSWQRRWLHFAALHSDEEQPMPADGEDYGEWARENEQGIHSWIDEVASLFSSEHRLPSRLQGSIDE